MRTHRRRTPHILCKNEKPKCQRGQGEKHVLNRVMEIERLNREKREKRDGLRPKQQSCEKMEVEKRREQAIKRREKAEEKRRKEQEREQREQKEREEREQKEREEREQKEREEREASSDEDLSEEQIKKYLSKLKKKQKNTKN